MSGLEIQDLVAAYDGGDVLHGITLRVDPGAFVAVIGANTAGKSTLLRAISGLLPRTRGRIRFRDQDLLTLPAHAMAAASARSMWSPIPIRASRPTCRRSSWD